jgi:nitrogen fixation/metabolism regulation signal transduction histidine kinase
MGYSRFNAGVALRAASLLVTLVLLAWMLVRTHWYVAIVLCFVAVLAQIALFIQFVTQAGREVARFLDAVDFDDAAQSFSGLGGDGAYRELGAAMARVSERLRASRMEREEQARYLQALVAHVPVALISVDQAGGVELLNMAARRLFETTVRNTGQFALYGVAFEAGMDSLGPGGTAVLKMDRAAGAMQLKVAATDLALGGKRRRLISLQNIESEMSAHELAAWQTVIRVLAHEMMNSLTPISSLAATAHTLTCEALELMPPDSPAASKLLDAVSALDAVARRSEGLRQFVQNHRRLTKRLEARIEMVRLSRSFAELRRLLEGDLAARDILLTTVVEPETLEVPADPELLDQALINLVRNAIEALCEEPAGRIVLSARRGPDGRVVIAVADNGPGIAPERREKVFVPFFTTKRQGSGVGLTLVRQIATVHGATVDISAAAAGGAIISLRF